MAPREIHCGRRPLWKRFHRIAGLVPGGAAGAAGPGSQDEAGPLLTALDEHPGTQDVLYVLLQPVGAHAAEL